MKSRLSFIKFYSFSIPFIILPYISHFVFEIRERGLYFLYLLVAILLALTFRSLVSKKPHLVIDDGEITEHYPLRTKKQTISNYTDFEIERGIIRKVISATHIQRDKKEVIINNNYKKSLEEILKYILEESK